MPDFSHLDWTSIALTLAGLAVAWFLIRMVLKLTLRIFACGCAVIGGLVLAGFVILNWEIIAKSLGL